ncbi:hypothetical protein SNE25_02135 [Mucilaginibacter sabulilitoris]|uniref:Uncharacterized protein n=1 Tax=Mucilaginibacter sabulilitoris TaxID=1173583 RepID=A0ABZ0TNF8_9SPHI|nr:hypothetical protein [Mucilaginibacter sabulilitoris]WPU94321.1 hypothetical protein SNE25_02135 [Mucilaginibacter sabulilitoris]
MSDRKLDYLIRKNKGKSIFLKYQEMFIAAGFKEGDIKHVDLMQSDKILNIVRQTFPNLKEEIELLASDGNFVSSRLISSTFQNLSDSKECYIYSDDVYFCGMYLAKIGHIHAYALNVAKYGYSNTCFIIDQEFKFSFTINFYDNEHPELKNTFDIHLRR